MAPDETRPVRDEDAVDVEAVVGWLRRNADDVVVPDGTPQIRQFPGGASNLTYLLHWPERDLILRRPPAGAKARGAHDMAREFLIQRSLAAVYPYVTPMVALCRDPSVVGSDFYVMERVDGVILRRDLPFELAPQAVSTLCENAWEALARLHDVDVSGVPELAPLARGEGYVERQVTGWTDRLARAATADLGDWGDLTAWLGSHRPPDSGQCLVHNDWRLDNMVLDPADGLRVVAVLDWEMATVGDPLMDLGGALAYWIQADDDEFFREFRRQPTTVPGMWPREQVVGWYAARRGVTVDADQWRFYEAFGLFRLAVIIQQIWYRYVRGETHNPAYAGFGEAVAYLEQRTRRIVGGG